MIYLRTKYATDFTRPTPADRMIRALFFFIPTANPDYEPQLHLVREWLIEFDDTGAPDREIGVDAEGVPMIGGPNERNYGF